jgi:hypothetical protein
MSLRLATVNENARSALDCGREAAAFRSFPSAHAPKTFETKAAASRPQSKVPSAQPFS